MKARSSARGARAHSGSTWSEFLKSLWGGRRERRAPRFVPTLRSLEDRALPATLGSFNAVAPLGSLVYEADGTGHLDWTSPAGARDVTRLTLDRGQTVTAVVTGAGDVQPVVQLLTWDGTVVGSATADGPGGTAVIQSVRLPGKLGGHGKPVNYRLAVSEVGSASGDFSVRLVLNAAVEQRAADGSQSLDGSFFELHGTADDGTPRPTRASVLGDVTATVAPGGVVQEQESNDPGPPGRYDFAQSIDNAGWNLSSNPDVTDSTTLPHVSVSATGDGTFDYFSFTVAAAGDRGVFDIDHENFDTMVYLYDANGNQLAFNDDFMDGLSDTLDPGDNASTASYLDYTFAAPGKYTLAVGAFFSGDLNGQLNGEPPPAGGEYTLQVSLQDHALSAAGADPVTETEPNDPSGTRAPDYLSFAQNLDGAGWVANTSDANFQDPTLPHLTVQATGDGTFDYYSFTLPAAGTVGVGVSPTSPPGSYPVQAFVYDLSGNLLGSVMGPGATSLNLPAGTYVVGVGTCATVNSGGLLVGTAPQPDTSYEVYVSAEGHAHTVPSSGADQYTFHLGAGQTAAVTVSGATPGGDWKVDVLDAAGNVVASSSGGAANVDAVASFTAAADGTYSVRVSSHTGGAYNLSVTRDAGVDLEGNDSIAAAQAFTGPSLDGQRWVVGAVGGSDTDFYKATGASGHDLTYRIYTPGGGDGAFDNGLAPVMRLYDSTGKLVACSTDGVLRYLVPKGKSGTYFVQVAAQDDSAGEYVLAVWGDRSA